MSKELKFEFNDYIIAIDEPYENDCGYVAIGKKDTKGNINIWFKSPNEQTVDFYIELQKHIADLEAKLAEKEEEIENLTLAHFESETNKPVLTTTQIINQDKILFAVEQLNQAKSKIQHNILFVDCDDYVNVIKEIDNQIKQLKEQQK